MKEKNTTSTNARSYNALADPSVTQHMAALKPPPLQLHAAPPPNSSGADPIQRKIKIRDGETYETPQPDDRPDIRRMKSQKSLFLMQGEADLNKVNTGGKSGVKILPPQKHVIGEKHIETRFEEAKNDWEWGAAVMSEQFASNDLMRGSDREDPAQQAVLPLEDTMTKNIASLLDVYFPISMLSEKLRNSFYDYQLGNNNEKVEIRRNIFTQCNTVVGKAPIIHKIILVLENFVSQRLANTILSPQEETIIEKKSILPKVVNAVTQSLGEITKFAGIRREMISAIDQELDEESQKKIAAKGKDLFIDRIENLDDEVNSLNESVMSLVNWSKEILQFHQPELYETHNLQDASIVQDLCKAREEHQRQRIENNLTSPGLVRVGSDHIKGLQGIPNTALYMDYTDFEEATKAENILDAS